MVDTHNLPDGKKKYFCDSCEKDFDTIQDAERHENSCTFTKDGLFKKSFTIECKVCDRLVAKITVTRPDEYQCPSCGTIYNVRNDGTIEYDIWACDFCDAQFIRKLDVDKHEKTCGNFKDILNNTRRLFKDSKKKIVKGEIDDVETLSRRRKEHSHTLNKLEEKLNECKNSFEDYKINLRGEMHRIYGSSKGSRMALRFDQKIAERNRETIDNYRKEINNFIKILSEISEYDYWNDKIYKAKLREKALDFDSAINIWEELELIDEAARVRKMQAEMGSVKVAQKVVHGDTIVKDSVLNRANVGGSSKMQELKDLTEMKKEGLIDDDEFKQMKKEILGK